MTDLETLLTIKFPRTNEYIEGQLVFLDQYGVDRIRKTNLENATHLTFYKAKFFTGYKKFTITDIVIGISGDNSIYLLTNPLFSDKYSDIVTQLERINTRLVNHRLISEIIDLYKVTGSSITEISNDKYQIWYGDNKWRVMEFENSITLKIKTVPNIADQSVVRSWWRKLLGIE